MSKRRKKDQDTAPHEVLGDEDSTGGVSGSGVSNDGASPEIEAAVPEAVDPDRTSPDLGAEDRDVDSFDGPEPDTQVGPGPMATAEPPDSWDEPTNVGTPDELAELAAASVKAAADEAPPADETPPANETPPAEEPPLDDGAPPPDGEEPPAVAAGRMASIIESLLFASDRPLSTNELKKLLAERETVKVVAAVEELRARRADTGVHVIQVAGGWHLRTNPENVAWVSRILTGKPPRLSRAMLETLAIVAYRQPITRPEVDEIRGVDCGPVIKTLLERNLVRMIGKKEEVGRPILYGTTPEFLRTFSLRDLTELPTLREFHELGEAEKAKVDAAAPAPATAPEPVVRPPTPVIRELDPAEEDELLSELDKATQSAAQAAAPPPSETPAQPEDETAGQ